MTPPPLGDVFYYERLNDRFRLCADYERAIPEPDIDVMRGGEDAFPVSSRDNEKILARIDRPYGRIVALWCAHDTDRVEIVMGLDEDVQEFRAWHRSRHPVKEIA